MTMNADEQLTVDQSNALLAELTPALEARKRDEVIRIIAALIAGKAPLGPRWQSMMQLLQYSGELTLTQMAMTLLLEQTNDDPAMMFQVAIALAAMGKAKQAGALVSLLPQGTIPAATRHHFLGTAHSELGDHEAAIASLLNALQAMPNSGQIWHALAVEHRFVEGDPQLQKLAEAARISGQEPANDRGLMQYALGKAMADIGRTDEAFAAFAKGAAIIAEARPYDINLDVDHANSVRNSWTAQATMQAPDASPRSKAPIFVVGLPRSGTTLVEQILTAHSAVGGGGENDVFRTTLELIGGDTPEALSNFVRAHGTPGLDRVQELHARLLDELFGIEGRKVDKALGNSRFLGLISRLFPNSPIIWVKRDPLDCAWSAFRTYFTSGQDWSWSLEKIAQHMRAEDGLLTHWQAVLGTQLAVVNYEQLVSTPQIEIPKMLEHCALPFEPSTLTPELNQRIVRSASVVQVRSPINTGAIGSAKPYRAHLQPFIDGYGNERTR